MSRQERLGRSLALIEYTLAHRVAINVNVLPLVLLQDLFVSAVVKFHMVEVLDEIQVLHGFDDILPVDRLALLSRGDLATLARDEGNELAHTLLHRLSGLLGNFGVIR